MPENDFLQTLLSALPANSLWCVDEAGDPLLARGFKGRMISNRFGVCARAQQAGLPILFNDFDLSHIGDDSLDVVVWRIAKEKLLNIHLIVSALQKINSGGLLHLIGYRDEGIESLLKLLQKHTDAVIERDKINKLQMLSIGKPSQIAIENSYPELQQLDGFYSKPGVFGWNKTDKGSQLLIQTLAERHINKEHRLLDLGCGYGYLSMQAKILGYRYIDATDNNAAAIRACQANFAQLGIEGEVIADDCAASIARQYDLILCNPPFHQGFDHNKPLTERFCQASARLLKPGGEAFFVVNQFIGLEKIAAHYFRHQHSLPAQQGFKIVCLTK